MIFNPLFFKSPAKDGESFSLMMPKGSKGNNLFADVIKVYNSELLSSKQQLSVSNDYTQQFLALNISNGDNLLSFLDNNEKSNAIISTINNLFTEIKSLFNVNETSVSDSVKMYKSGSNILCENEISINSLCNFFSALFQQVDTNNISNLNLIKSKNESLSEIIDAVKSGKNFSIKILNNNGSIQINSKLKKDNSLIANSDGKVCDLELILDEELLDKNPGILVKSIPNSKTLPENTITGNQSIFDETDEEGTSIYKETNSEGNNKSESNPPTTINIEINKASVDLNKYSALFNTSIYDKDQTELVNNNIHEDLKLVQKGFVQQQPDKLVLNGNSITLSIKDNSKTPSTLQEFESKIQTTNPGSVQSNELGNTVKKETTYTTGNILTKAQKADSEVIHVNNDIDKNAIENFNLPKSNSKIVFENKKIIQTDEKKAYLPETEIKASDALKNEDKKSVELDKSKIELLNNKTEVKHPEIKEDGKLNIWKETSIDGKAGLKSNLQNKPLANSESTKTQPGENKKTKVEDDSTSLDASKNADKKSGELDKSPNEFFNNKIKITYPEVKDEAKLNSGKETITEGKSAAKINLQNKADIDIKSVKVQSGDSKESKTGDDSKSSEALKNADKKSVEYDKTKFEFQNKTEAGLKTPKVQVEENKTNKASDNTKTPEALKNVDKTEIELPNNKTKILYPDIKDERKLNTGKETNVDDKSNLKIKTQNEPIEELKSSKTQEEDPVPVAKKITLNKDLNLDVNDYEENIIKNDEFYIKTKKVSGLKTVNQGMEKIFEEKTTDKTDTKEHPLSTFEKEKDIISIKKEDEIKKSDKVVENKGDIKNDKTSGYKNEDQAEKNISPSINVDKESNQKTILKQDLTKNEKIESEQVNKTYSQNNSDEKQQNSSHSDKKSNSENALFTKEISNFTKVSGNEFTNSSENVKSVKYTEVLKEISKFIISKDKSSITFNLEPESLGKLHIKLEIIDNNAKVIVEVENEAVKKLIENNLNNLYQNLNQNGLNLLSLQVSTTAQDNKQMKQANQSKKKFDLEKELITNSEEELKTKNLGYNTYEFLI